MLPMFHCETRTITSHIQPHRTFQFYDKEQSDFNYASQKYSPYLFLIEYIL